jgi:hypothetical protein
VLGGGAWRALGGLEGGGRWRRAGMAEQWDLDEEGIRRLGALTLEQPGRGQAGGRGPGACGQRLGGES